MDQQDLRKEQQILRQMRKTLGNVVRDVTPLGGRPNPLTQSTIQDIKDCFTLISDRERELADQLGFDPSRPYFNDDEDKPDTQSISFIKPTH